MQILTFTVLWALFISLLLAPIFLFFKLKQSKWHFLSYFILGLVITSGITLTFTWWADYSDKLLLSHYGYDPDAMTASERYANVKRENLVKVKEIEIAYYGIGWPLKAIVIYALYLPYLLIAYLAGITYRKMK